MDSPTENSQSKVEQTPAGGVLPPQQPAHHSDDKKKKLMTIGLITVAVVVVLGVVAFALTGSDKKKDEDTKAVAKVKVGVMLAMSGGSSSMGYGASKGIQLAKKQLGTTGANIELIEADGKCDPETAKSAMQYLIEKKVQIVIGENCSSASVAVLELANTSKIPLISPSASSPKLSIENDYFFRTVPSDIGQGSFLAEAMYNKGIRKAAVFYTNEPYGIAINDVFKAKFESLGGTIATAVNAESSVIDVETQVAAIKAAKPDGLAIVTNSTVSSTAVMKLAREKGVTVPFYGGDNLYDNTIITNGGTAADGLHVVSFPTGTKAFKQDLTNEYNVTEQLYAAPEAYDAYHTVYKAIQKGAKTGADFKRIIPTIKFTGVSSPIEFDKFGEIPYQGYLYDLLEVKEGAFSIVQQ